MIRSQQLSKGNQKAIKSTQGKANREKKERETKNYVKIAFILMPDKIAPPPQARVV